MGFPFLVHVAPLSTPRTTPSLFAPCPVVSPPPQLARRRTKDARAGDRQTSQNQKAMHEPSFLPSGVEAKVTCAAWEPVIRDKPFLYFSSLLINPSFLDHSILPSMGLSASGR